MIYYAAGGAHFFGFFLAGLRDGGKVYNQPVRGRCAMASYRSRLAVLLKVEKNVEAEWHVTWELHRLEHVYRCAHRRESQEFKHSAI